MADSIGRLIFKEKQLKLLLALSDDTKEWHLDGLAAAAGVTYVHTSRFISRCEKEGIAGVERHGRTKRVFLTKKGKDLASSLSVVVTLLSQQAQPVPANPPAPAAATQRQQ